MRVLWIYKRNCTANSKKESAVCFKAPSETTSHIKDKSARSNKTSQGMFFLWQRGKNKSQ